MAPARHNGYTIPTPPRVFTHIDSQTTLTPPAYEGHRHAHVAGEYYHTTRRHHHYSVEHRRRCRDTLRRLLEMTPQHVTLEKRLRHWQKVLYERHTTAPERSIAMIYFNGLSY